MANSLIENKSAEAKLTIGDLLRIIREILNISIRAASKETGISELAIQKIEKNTSAGSWGTFYKLCNLYEISMDDLLFWSTEESSTNEERAKDVLYSLLMKSAEKRLGDENSNQMSLNQL